MSSLADVSCTTSTDCVAVGFERDRGEQTLVETWNGSTWTVVPSQNPNPRNILKGVSYTGTMSCVAVGSSWSGASGSPTASLVESWNGTSWSVVPSPAPSNFSQLSGVSCTSPTFCVGVGSYGTSYGAASNTLVETWDGTSWTVTPSSDGPDSSDDQFYRVSCASPTSCMAVGSDVTTNGTQTLAETWNGTSWTVTSGPIANAVFFGVSCLSATLCVAVGLDEGKTLVESWNGTTLTVVPSPNPAKYRDLLGAVLLYKYHELREHRLVPARRWTRSNARRVLGRDELVYDAQRHTEHELLPQWRRFLCRLDELRSRGLFDQLCGCH